MSDSTNTPAPFVPYVSADHSMKEFTLRALLIGLVLSVALGAANAYLGLKAGMTIAATYPAAVLGMTFLRLFKHTTILEENLARTVGSIGESVAAGAIFTIPAFMIAGVWTEMRYLEATAIMLVGGVLGVLFVTLLRRVMVEDVDLPFPESKAAAEIHKAGRTGGTGAKFLLMAGGIGVLIQSFKEFKLFAVAWEKFIPFGKSAIKVELESGAVTVTGSGGMLLSSPGVSPAYMGVGYIIGPKLASLNFAGGLLAWGLFVPLLTYFLGPSFEGSFAAVTTEALWSELAANIWKGIVRPIAIGGMLVSAAYTLWKMRKNLFGGMKRSVSDVRKAAASANAPTDRLQRDLPIRIVFLSIGLASLATFGLYYYFVGSLLPALAAALVMVVAGFLFAAVSGYLVGMIGSSNNPISGLTLSTLIVAALLMVLLGQKGVSGIVAVLGVASVICVAAAVAGEMLQDLKVGHLLGGTPWKMQVGDLIGVVVASAIMFFPLMAMHQGDINVGGTGFGGKALPAPQASLMALLSRGIVNGEMAWPLIIVGMLMAVAFILVQIKSPMLVCVGMYLPLETSFAIFIGGVIRGILDYVAERRQMNGAQKARIENNGVLLASGLIAGEALIGIVFAALNYYKVPIPSIFANPSFGVSLLVFVLVGFVLIRIPLKNAGKPNDPAPPVASV